MYLSKAEEYIALILCLGLIIGFGWNTYQEIQDLKAEQIQRRNEKRANEAKIKILIAYFKAKKKLFNTLSQTKSVLEEKKKENK